MAMTDDNQFPRLMPPDDNYPASDRLLRKPEELTDEQFDLLAAAWSEEALAGDQLSELEEIMTAIPSRRMRAESFNMVRLVPYDDKWAGRNRLLRQPPSTRAIRRSLVVTLLAAAAVVVLIITGPAIRNRTTEMPRGALRDGAAMSEALITEAYPVIIPDRVKAEPGGVLRVTKTEMQAAVRTADMTEPELTVHAGDQADPGKAVHSAESAEQTRALPLSLAINAVNPVIIAAAGKTSLQAVQMAAIIPAPSHDKADNWIIRSLSFIAKSITKEEKKIDGYFVASACVNGLNNALGWEMELEQSGNKNGETVAVNFNSSLLSFSAPVNKNSPRL